MKKYFSILLVLLNTFCFADDIFEEADEDEVKTRLEASIPFRAQENLCTDDGHCEDGFCIGNDDIKPPLKDRSLTPLYGIRKKDDYELSYGSWTKYKASFGVEKIFVRFPQKPAISQSNTMLTAYAYDNAVLYSLSGYYPPMGHIDPLRWFDEVLYSISTYPINCLNHVVFQLSNGDWILDYVAHDIVKNLIIKTRAIVTPFNAYTIQCVKPNGSGDYFDYYLDNIVLQRGD